MIVLFALPNSTKGSAVVLFAFAFDTKGKVIVLFALPNSTKGNAVVPFTFAFNTKGNVIVLFASGSDGR